MAGGDRMAEERQREPSYAWVVVGVMFFAQAVALGVRGTIGLLVNPWEAEFGWDRAAVSLTASLGFVVYGLAQAFSGRWADRTGPRVIFATSVALLGVGTMAVSSIVTLWQAYAIFGVLIMLGIGGASSPTSAVAVARWFTARRGLALGIVGAGSAAGQFVLVPVMATLIGSLGWRAAFLWLGVGILAVALPIIVLLLRDDPSQGSGQAGAAASDVGSPMPMAEILRHANFWWLALSFFVCGVTTSGLIDTHFIPYAQDHHVAAVTAATAFGLLSLVNMVFTTLSGAVSDRFGYTRLLGWIYAGRAVTLVVPGVRAGSGVAVRLRGGVRHRGLLDGRPDHRALDGDLRSPLGGHGVRPGRAEPPDRVRPGLVRGRAGPRPHRELRGIHPRRSGAVGRRGVHVVGDLGVAGTGPRGRARLTVRP